MDTRMTGWTVQLVATAGLLAASLPLAAHHGTNISYDRAKTFTRQAVVTSFEYRNPHPQLHADVNDDKGATESWGLELAPNPAQLIRNGWGRQRSTEALKPGTEVMVTVAPSKAGGLVGLLLRVTTLQGEEIVGGGAGGGGRQGEPGAGREGGGRGAS